MHLDPAPYSDTPSPVGASPLRATAGTGTRRDLGRRTLQRRTRWATLGLVLAAAVALAAALQSSVLQPFVIPSPSMAPTLLPGDYVLVDKRAFGWRLPFSRITVGPTHAPAVGEIVVFRAPFAPAVHFVKRLAGGPGDTLAMRDGTLWRNGSPIARPVPATTHPAGEPGGFLQVAMRWQRTHALAGAPAEPTSTNWGPILVPPGSYFMLGDNTQESLDSRFWGFVPATHLVGRPILIVGSLDPDESHPLGARLRPERAWVAPR